MWSWQGLSIPSGRDITAGVLFKSGSYVPDYPSLSINSVPAALVSTDCLSCSVYVRDSRSATIDAIVVIDDDLSRIGTFATGIPSAPIGRSSFALASYDWKAGGHSFAFYAAATGRVSPAVAYLITFGAGG
jgi:hypothetical protein